MTEIRFTSEINVPYERETKDPALFDPTEKDAADGINNLLTAQDLKDLVKAPTTDEVVRGEGKNYLMDALNQTLVRAFRNPVKNMDSYRQQLLTPDEVQITANKKEVEKYANKLMQSKAEKEVFAKYLAQSKTAEPFAAQILNQLAKTDEGALLSGWFFSKIADPNLQRDVLLQMDNIGAAARMLMWTEACVETTHGDVSIYNKRCTEWAASDPKLALICATKGGTALDLPETFTGMNTAVRQDRPLSWLVQYYETKNFEALVEGLEMLKKEHYIEDFRISRPNANGDIETVEIYFVKMEDTAANHPAKYSKVFVENKKHEQMISDFLRQEETVDTKGNLVLKSFYREFNIDKGDYNGREITRSSIFDPQGHLVEFSYSAGWPGYERGSVTQIEYDPQGKEIRRREWEGGILVYETNRFFDSEGSEIKEESTSADYR
ncbi:MAG: hypothetical protein Q8P84_00210 [Deltaproteobacteria bacterium]|nr:hypothetical protein [Deltaproteobacteria bacterium]